MTYILQHLINSLIPKHQKKVKMFISFSEFTLTHSPSADSWSGQGSLRAGSGGSGGSGRSVCDTELQTSAGVL